MGCSRWMISTWFILYGLLLAHCNDSEQVSKRKILIVLTTQDNPHHNAYAKINKAHMREQLNQLKTDLAGEVLISTEHWPDLYGAWTFSPLLQEIGTSFDTDGFHWVLLIPEFTELNVANLLNIMKRYEHTTPQFIGHALKDVSHVITHHFHPPGLLYPDIAAGILMSWPTVEKFDENLYSKVNFNIDTRHELAKSLIDAEIALTDEEGFCAPGKDGSEKCATYYEYLSTLCPPSRMHPPVKEDDIFVLVKTGEVFHESRVPLQQRMWTKQVKNLEYCSEKQDDTIPTVKVDAPNTEKGHCAKFKAIMKRAYTEEHIKNKKWIVIVDDDTIMNVGRLAKLLSCYVGDDPVVIGERYGYMSHTHGYDYITGGGGTVMNKAALKALLTSGNECGSDDSPDDMMLGVWLKRLGIPVLHSPLFHQAPPSTYTPTYLEPQRDYAISFHKYDQDEPEQTARNWLGLMEKPSEHDEL